MVDSLVSTDPESGDFPPPAPSKDTREREPLWRHMLGDGLRRARRDHGETLEDVARRAGVSPQYLSEIERGLKEPSSEIIAAVADSLGLTLLDLTLDVAHALTATQRPTSPRLSVRGRSTFALAA